MASLTVLSACGGGSTGSNGNTNPAQPPPTDTVSGTVLYKGAPLAGATVTELLANTSTVIATVATNASGNYSFSGLTTSGDAISTYQFWVTKTGYGFYPSVGSGAKVTRADENSQFLNNANGIGISYTVIQFDSLANESLSGADFNAFDGSNPLVSLPATGQNASYANGDDGAKKLGVAWPATRFTDNLNGTVTDHLTGLIWLRKADCFTPTIFETALTDANQLASGSCGLTDGSKAGDWRMPNLNELESLVDVSQSNPALTAGNPFTGVSMSIYWTSTSYYGGNGPAGSPYAWTIRLSDGRYINDTVNNVKTTSTNEVWAVKGTGGGSVNLQSTGFYVVYSSGDDGSVQAGVPPTFPRWLDNGNGTIIDTVTGLYWLKMADCINDTWSNAVAKVNLLASGQCGLTDGSVAGSWRMPNRNEMQSLSDRMQANHADFFNNTFTSLNGTIFQAPIFTDFVVGQYYWTSTTDAADTTEAWTVFSCDYGVYDTPKSATGYTLAVR